MVVRRKNQGRGAGQRSGQRGGGTVAVRVHHVVAMSFLRAAWPTSTGTPEMLAAHRHLMPPNQDAVADLGTGEAGAS